ncbi:MAG: patatin-like phospholipase family protein [Pseudomonadota bacterium]
MPASRRSARHEKAVNIALQGGGSHGAFTWGVLDKLFEDDRIWIEAISGTSAGAMNAVVAAEGMYDGGAEGARAALRAFWTGVAKAGAASPLKRSMFSRATGDYALDDSPGYLFLNFLKNFASPYDLNPFDINPLRDLVEEMIDFRKVRDCANLGVFLGATNVETGRARVFGREEVTADAVMASACLPSIYKAVEIGGEHFWDGGFTGNPPLFPFYESSPSDDIVIVQINPIVRPGPPKRAADIQNRLNEITFNSALLAELRAVDFVTRLLDAGTLEPSEYRRMHIHMIQDRKEMRALSASSKLNTEWAFLEHLFEVGRRAAERWLATSFDDLGERSSVDVRGMFQGVSTLPTR